MTQETYLLGSGPPSREIERLDVQHAFWAKLTGRTLLPKPISSYLATVPSPRVGDLGTGNANWLVDLGTQLPPTSTLAGFDISADIFPPADKRPGNLTLEIHNAIEPFPEEYLGTFDVVHARLLTYGVKKGEWQIIARNIFALLKPGGWVMFEETGYPSWVTIPPSNAVNAILEVDIAFAKKVGRDLM